ncbi:MAG: dihydroorotate dehydrogenase electron transfer subunit [Candidatus Competibacter sp.]|nr:dihydroorotate dehydrogenase electron transfer subunit [Candidatus Competibacter sp.]
MGQVLSCQDYPGGYRLLRVATRLATELRPGHGLRIDGAAWAALQPAPQQGWVDCLQRGAAALATPREVAVSGPFGEAFDLAAATPRALLLADGDGIAPSVFLARALRDRQPRTKAFALFELAPPLPFRPPPSRIMTPGLPAGVIAALPLLEDWAIPSRLACPAGDVPGCFEGEAAELARSWLDIAQGVSDVTVFACGNPPFLAAARELAARHGLACQTREAFKGS